MKKFSFFAAILAAVTMLFTACPHPPVPPTTIVYDGFYVIGEATNVPTLTSEGADLSVMSPGYNENSSNEIRDGLYEKYIALEGGKPFSLVLKEGATETNYGATLSEVNLANAEGGNVRDQPNITILRGVMTENTTMQVAESGLYHIVLDLNKDGKLADKSIIIAPVTWGVRGGMNSWGFTAMNASEFNKTSMSFTVDIEETATGEWKFAYGSGWKIELNEVADPTADNDERFIKANTNLGAGDKEGTLKPGGANLPLNSGKNVKITLNWNLKAGNIGDSFDYTIEYGEVVIEDPATFVVGFSGTAFATESEWCDPVEGITKAELNAELSNFDATTLNGTYVYTIDEIDFLEGKEFKYRFNGAWLGWGEFTLTGDTENFTEGNGGNIKVTYGKVYKATITVVWDNGKATSHTVNLVENA